MNIKTTINYYILGFIVMKHNLFVQYISSLVCGRCKKRTIINNLLHAHKSYACSYCGYLAPVKTAHKHKMIVDKRL